MNSRLVLLVVSAASVLPALVVGRRPWAAVTPRSTLSSQLRHRHFVPGVLLVALVFSATACGGGGGEPAAKTATTTPTGSEEQQGEPSGQTSRIAYDCGTPPQICLMSTDGSGVRRLTKSGNNESASWSPAGDELAFSRYDTSTGAFQLVVMNADGSNIQKITGTAGNKLFADWSPDGRKLVFADDRDGNFDVYVINADGSGETRLTNDPAEDIDPAWSPDGNAIAFARASQSEGSVIYVMDADGADATALGPGVTPSWSPDGSKLAIVVPGSIGVVDLAEGTLEKITTGFDHEPTWSPDGTHIAFRRGQDGNAEIYAVKSDGTELLQLTHNSVNDVSPAWSPD
jgi:Tol biopolymer transport system component